MQPKLQQDVKFNYSAKQAVMQKYLTLSDRATGPTTTGVKDATILIWPESAFPFFLTRKPMRWRRLPRCCRRARCCSPARSGLRMRRRPHITARTNSIYAIGPRWQHSERLRQAASGAVRRISAVPAGDGKLDSSS